MKLLNVTPMLVIVSKEKKRPRKETSQGGSSLILRRSNARSDCDLEKEKEGVALHPTLKSNKYLSVNLIKLKDKIHQKR